MCSFSHYPELIFFVTANKAVSGTKTPYLVDKSTANL
jgi:hypothetical protein